MNVRPKNKKRMINGDLAGYINYFERFAEQHEKIKFFHFGQVEKGITFARGLPGFGYPFLWLEQPEILTFDNGAAQMLEIYLGGVVVLQHGNLSDVNLNRQAYIDSINVLYDLQKQMRLDARTAKLVCSLSDFKKEAVSTLWADAHYGWRMEFRAEYNLNFRV